MFEIHSRWDSCWGNSSYKWCGILNDHKHGINMGSPYDPCINGKEDTIKDHLVK